MVSNGYIFLFMILQRHHTKSLSSPKNQLAAVPGLGIVGIVECSFIDKVFKIPIGL